MESRFLHILLLAALVPAGAQAESSYEFSARLIVDAVDYQIRPVNTDESVRNGGDDFYVRQAKFKLEAEPLDWLTIEAAALYNQYDEGKIGNLFVEFKPIKDWSLFVGQFKEPSGMERMQSVASQFFSERSLATNVFTPTRKPGVKVEFDGNWAWVQAAYMQEDSRSGHFDDGVVYAARAATNLFRNEEKDGFLHLGGFYSTRDEIELRFDIDEPVIARSFGNTFHSPNYYAERIDTGGVEFAVGYRQFIFQAEYFAQELYERDGDEWQQDGYYATLSWTVFGEPRRYRNAKIRFNEDNDSALEISARVSAADTVNFSEGDRATVYSIAGNYYFRERYKFTLEYESAELEGFDSGVIEEFSGNSITFRLNASL